MQLILPTVNNFNFLIWNGGDVTNCKHVSDKIRVLSLPSLFFQRKCNGCWRPRRWSFPQVHQVETIYIVLKFRTRPREWLERGIVEFRESVLSSQEMVLFVSENKVSCNSSSCKKQWHKINFHSFMSSRRRSVKRNS